MIEFVKMEGLSYSTSTFGRYAALYCLFCEYDRCYNLWNTSLPFIACFFSSGFLLREFAQLCTSGISESKVTTFSAMATGVKDGTATSIVSIVSSPTQGDATPSEARLPLLSVLFVPLLSTIFV